MLDSVIHGGSYLAEVVMAQFSLSGPHSFIYRAHHYPHNENKHSLRGSRAEPPWCVPLPD